jgi:NAD(P)H dehydrogenase (quinone)
MKKNILIIQGHPNKDSLSSEILNAYRESAEQSGAEVRAIIVRELEFQPVLFLGYKRTEPLENDILRSQEQISWADHLVMIYPNWWGTYPAMFKGFIDKVLWPGFAFSFQPGRDTPQQLLKGKSARIFVTMDSSRWTYRFRQGAPGHKAMKLATLGFCGISPVNFTTFYRIRYAKKEKTDKWTSHVKKLGRRMI